MDKIETTEDLKAYVCQLVGNEYTVLGEYSKANAKILMRHEICGNQFITTLACFMSGDRCKCPKNKFNTVQNQIQYTTDDFKTEVYDAVGDEYTVLGEYSKANEKILMRHNKCNSNYRVTPASFKSGTRCRKCGKKKSGQKRSMGLETFQKRVYELEGDNYIVVGEYKNINTPIAIMHTVCGNVIGEKTTPYTFLKNWSRCKICGKEMSKGVRKINDALRARNLEFTLEKTYDKLKDINVLRYDFFLKTNKNIHCLIEFDGAQHFKPAIWDRVKDILTQKEKAIEKLLLQHEHDMMKEEYAEKNKIPLLRIRYDQVDKIEEMIDDLLAHPKKYIYRHNTYLTQEEYWAPFEKSMKKIRPKYSTACA